MKLKNIKFNYKTLFITVAGAAVLASCSLDSPPRDKIPVSPYEIPKEVEQGVIGAYSRARYLSNDLYLLMSEVRSDNMWVNPVTNALREYSELGTFRSSASDAIVQATWKDLYEMIYAANQVIYSIDNVDFEGDTAFKEQLLGEVHFIRGWAYFELARLYGNVPIITYDDGVLVPNEVKEVKQSPAEVVYNQIVLPDLKLAEQYLPMPGNMKQYDGADATEQGRADRIAVKAMLARVYMTMAGFPLNDASAQASAETYLKEVLDYATSNGKYWAPNITEWRKQFTKEGNNLYSIFAIQHRVGGSGNPAVFNFSKAPAPSYTSIRIMGNDIYVEKTLQFQYTREFTTGNRDLRGFDWTVLNGYDAEEPDTPKYGNTQEWYVDPETGEADSVYTMSFFYKFLESKYKVAELGLSDPEDGMLDYNDWPINYPVIRLEDVQLMYAEILVSKGDISGALKYVNDIRARAGIDPVPTGVSQAQALEYVKRERRLELAGEGIRWFDIVRYDEWQEDILDMFDRYKNVDGDYPTGIQPSNVSAGRYLYPIPQTQIESFPGLYVQNTGY